MSRPWTNAEAFREFQAMHLRQQSRDIRAIKLDIAWLFWSAIVVSLILMVAVGRVGLG